MTKIPSSIKLILYFGQYISINTFYLAKQLHARNRAKSKTLIAIVKQPKSSFKCMNYLLFS